MPRSKFTFVGMTEAQIAADPDITYARASGAGRFLSSGLYAWDAGNDTPHQNHYPDGNYRGLTLEFDPDTNWFLDNHNIDFANASIGTSTGAGLVGAAPNSVIGIDGQSSATRFTMTELEARWWSERGDLLGQAPDGRYGLYSYYAKRDGFADPVGVGINVRTGGFAVHVDPFDTPAAGFGEIVAPVSDIVAADNQDVYWMNKRNNTPANSGPNSLIACAFMRCFKSIGRFYTPPIYIPTAGSAVSRARATLSLAVDDGRYNVVVTGDVSGRAVYVNQQISGGSYDVMPNPQDNHVQDVEFLPVLDTVPNGGPTIERKTVGSGGDYADWPAAIAAMPPNLVSANVVWWLVQLPGEQDLGSTQLVFNTITDALHPLVISCADHGHPSHNNVEQWYGTRNRTRIRKDTGQAIDIRCDYAQLFGLSIQGALLSNATNPGDASKGLVSFRDCIIDRLLSRSGGAYVEAYNCLYKGVENIGVHQSGGALNGLLVNCTAMYGATAGTTAAHDGINGGAIVNSIAANYFTNSGLQSALKEACASTDGSATGPGASLTYGQIFANAFPDPAPAAGLKAIVAGDRWPLAQHDIRQIKRPAVSVVPGVQDDSAAVDKTINQIVAGLAGGQGAVVSKGPMASVAGNNIAYWDGSGGSAVGGFDGDWYSPAIIPLATGGFILVGHGGGHSGYNGVEIYFFSTVTRKWTRVDAEAKRRYEADDATFGSNLVINNKTPYDVGVDADFGTVLGVPEAFHCYGGNGNPAWFQGTGNVNGYLLFVPSSAGPAGNGAFGNRLNILNLDTMRWEKAHSAQNGQAFTPVGTGGKAFVDTDNNESWYASANRVCLKAGLSAAMGAWLQTGDGQASNVWFVLQGIGDQQTGLDGSACFWPGNARALQWQPAVNNGNSWAWIDIASGNPNFIPVTPSGDVPPDGSLFGMNGVFVPTTGTMFLYNGQRLWELDPSTLVFTERTPSQLGVDYKVFGNFTAATQASKARIGYLPTEDALVLGGRSSEDIIVFNPAATPIEKSGTGVASVAFGSSSIGQASRAGVSVASQAVTSMVAGFASKSGMGAASIALNASSAGLSGRSGTGAVSQAFGSTAVGVSGRSGVSAPIQAISASSVGVADRQGSGVASVSLSATSTGESSEGGQQGTGLAQVAFDVVVQGSSGRSGSGVASIDIGAASSGQASRRGSSVIPVSVEAVSQGEASRSGSGVAPIAFSASSAGSKSEGNARSGTGVASVSFGAAELGASSRSGFSAANQNFAGTSVGVSRRAGFAQAAVGFTSIGYGVNGTINPSLRRIELQGSYGTRVPLKGRVAAA